MRVRSCQRQRSKSRLGPVAGSVGYKQKKEQRSKYTEGSGSLFIFASVREGSCKYRARVNL